MTSMPGGHRAGSADPACATSPELFLHPLLEEPPSDDAAPGPAVADELVRLLRRGRDACAACPLFAECLYAAVVHRDVAGFVACTTAAERAGIRAALGVDVADEDLDAVAGVRGERRPLDHEAVLAARAAFPHDSLEALAHRLDCSLSTVKRHLRRARRERAASEGAGGNGTGGTGGNGPGAGPDDRPAPRTPGVPTVDDVLDAFDVVVDHVV